MLFGSVFGLDVSVAVFERRFLKTFFGYSYHGLLIDEDVIVGHYACIPFKYTCFGQVLCFALAASTMIDAKYQGNPFNLKRIAELTYESMVRDKIAFVFSLPNDNIYLIRKRVLKWIDIGELDYYILPVRIGGLNRFLRVFDLFFLVYAGFVNKMVAGINDKRICHEVKYNIEKNIVDSNFMDYRYAEGYKIVVLAGGKFFVYRVMLEENVRVAYLIDVSPLRRNIIEYAVKHIYRCERNNVDLIVYIGKLKDTPLNLFKVPRLFEPRRLRMAGKILIDNLVDDEIFNIDNWNVNLSNFDVR